MKATNILFLVFAMNFYHAQTYKKQKSEIQNLITVFKKCIITKDTATFKSLFTKDSFNWVAVIKDKSQQKRLQKKTLHPSNIFTKTSTDFYQFLIDEGKQEEIFKNVRIENDDVIGSVTFDYFFLSNNKTTNWGKEFWQLAKIEGQWKIISAMYSLEFN
ncbi:hypothetical protein CEY12_17205 [Chryseobacterium sp. T16E-39]|uniref:hypothetical protein n=1 Tax=Chryseobacterium sp. T16E-39 TaxID=2015076 RepID=UPI000B5B3280|nr:hypothetical protein [Chryseobacterium sp. T16E-39]ASK31742.1 hypothetical protein CEY12_17205 [Chryseobacterium sp. T16E-39]